MPVGYTCLMPTREDFIGQNNPNVQIYAADHGLIPAYVDDSPMITEEDMAGLDNTAFANPYRRTYPCHTKVACVQSALWDAATNPGNELVTNNIRKMAAAHGVSEDVEKIYTHFRDAFTKAAAANAEVKEEEPEYALELIDDNGEKQGFFEVTYPQDVVHSAEEADKQYRAGNIGDSPLRKIASGLVKAAKRHNVPEEELPRTIRTFGTTRIPDPYEAEVTVRDFCKRSNVNPAPYLDGVNRLQQFMEKASAITDAIMAANLVADGMVELNLRNGITPRLEDSPYTLLFNGPELEDFNKRAASTVYIMDVPVPAQAVVGMPDEFVTAHFASKAASIIHQAQERLKGGDDLEKAAAAAELISQMSPEAKKELLRALATQE